MYYLSNGILLNHKRKEILLFVTTWVKLEYIKINEIGQKRKGKYCMMSFILGI